MKRKGIALIITIAFVAAITALIGISSGLLDNAFKRISNKLFLIQSNVVFADFIGVLKEASRDVNDSLGLDIFLSVPLYFENEANSIIVDISFESQASKVNINHLIKETGSKKEKESFEPIAMQTAYEEYLNQILAVYNLSDKILLLSMIADTIDSDLKERLSGSELALSDPFFTQGQIYSLHHFEQITAAYKKQTLDFNVDLVPWDKLIGFQADQIDFNHINPEVLQHLVPALDPESTSLYTTDKVDIYESMEDLPFEAETKKLLQGMNVVFYSPYVHGKMNINNDARTMQIAFTYDLSEQKVSNIEVSD